MKKIVLLACLIVPVGMQAAADGNWIVGGFVDAEKNIYEGGEDEAQLLPYVAYETDRLHIGIDGIDYRFLDTDALSIAATLDYRSALDFPDTALFQGLERDDAVELGFEATYSFGEVYASFAFAGDVSDAYNGYQGQFAFGYETEAGPVHLDAKAGIDFRDKNLNNYLFGVASDEVKADRAAFEIGDAVNGFASVTAAYGLTDNAFLIGEMTYKDLGEANDSPLVSAREDVSLVIGVGWQF